VSHGGDVHADYQYQMSNAVLKLWGSYSHVKGQLSFEGHNYATDLPNVATHKLKVGATYFYQQKYALTPTLVWIGRTNSSQSQPEQLSLLQTVPSYLKMDLYAKAKINNNLNLFFNINNIFDKRYYNTGDAYSASRVASPQNPRLISTGFDYQF
jgi:outer membrane receptor protein involved in Fe transport